MVICCGCHDFRCIFCCYWHSGFFGSTQDYWRLLMPFTIPGNVRRHTGIYYVARDSCDGNGLITCTVRVVTLKREYWFKRDWILLEKEGDAWVVSICRATDVQGRESVETASSVICVDGVPTAFFYGRERFSGGCWKRAHSGTSQSMWTRSKLDVICHVDKLRWYACTERTAHMKSCIRPTKLFLFSEMIV